MRASRGLKVTHRRCRRGGAPAGHAGRVTTLPVIGVPVALVAARRPGLTALDRPDASWRAGRNGRDQRCDERRTAWRCESSRLGDDALSDRAGGRIASELAAQAHQQDRRITEELRLT